MLDVPKPSTHDWAAADDTVHISGVRLCPELYVGALDAYGLLHMLAEVLAYPIDEAEYGYGTRIDIRFCADGSVSISDDGRGTAIHRTATGYETVKPVLTSADLRYFDIADSPVLLISGFQRRGMSVVNALSERLIHQISRDGQVWREEYCRGIEALPLTRVGTSEVSGTFIQFWPDKEVFKGTSFPRGADLDALGMAISDGRIRVVDERR